MRRAICTLLSLLGTATAHGQQQACAVLPQSRVLTVAPRGSNQQSLNLQVSLGGGKPIGMQVDTGSTGIAVWSGRIPPPLVPADVALLPMIDYNSSGRVLSGRWVYTSVTITGANGESVQIDKLPVLAVDYMLCPTCGTPAGQQQALEELSMMGVGFDRGMGMGLAPENPFLHIREMEAGTMQHAYVVTNSSITFGLPADLSGFTFLPLQPLSDPLSWAQAQGCVQISGGAIDKPFGPVCGKILMDTGVSEMFVSYDPAGRPTFGGCQVTRFPPGTTVSVTWPSASSPQFQFKFDVLSNWTWTSPAPRQALWGATPTGTPVFVNTSRQLLWTADYLYDASCGRIGFRPH
ncbi:MAG TPA: hypothetical protein VFV49_13195 [Thermoanaerobaculia bacterium]|nr:hypothetical protein [Thermoanaerobaculia bacterium]